jgi:uncharacterized membrane protein YhaH (DUF805 family)
MGMDEILAAIRRGLGNALRFSGRDARRQFWPYAIFLFLASTGLGYVAMVPELMRLMTGAVELVEKAQRDQAAGRPFSSGSQALPPELVPHFEGAMIWSALLTGIAVILLAAAVTRRLHDRGKPGYWGLIPLPFAALALALAPRGLEEGMMMAQGAPPSPFWSLLMLINLVYWGAIVLLVLILAREGDAGPNRFGPAPEAPHP